LCFLLHEDKLIDEIIESLINLTKGRILRILKEDITTEERLSKIASVLVESLRASSIIENLVINTEIRKSKQKEIYKKYMTSYGSIEKEDCDIDLLSLLN
jgi:hypothetical protein